MRPFREGLRLAAGTATVVVFLACAFLGFVAVWSAARGRGWVEARLAGIDPSDWRAWALARVDGLEQTGTQWGDGLIAVAVLVAALLLVVGLLQPGPRRWRSLETDADILMSSRALEKAAEEVARSEVEGVTKAKARLRGRDLSVSTLHASSLSGSAVRSSVVAAVTRVTEPFVRRVVSDVHDDRRRRVV